MAVNEIKKTGVRVYDMGEANISGTHLMVYIDPRIIGEHLPSLSLFFSQMARNLYEENKDKPMEEQRQVYVTIRFAGPKNDKETTAKNVTISNVPVILNELISRYMAQLVNTIPDHPDAEVIKQDFDTAEETLAKDGDYPFRVLLVFEKEGATPLQLPEDWDGAYARALFHETNDVYPINIETIKNSSAPAHLFSLLKPLSPCELKKAFVDEFVDYKKRFGSMPLDRILNRRKQFDHNKEILFNQSLRWALGEAGEIFKCKASDAFKDFEKNDYAKLSDDIKRLSVGGAGGLWTRVFIESAMQLINGQMRNPNPSENIEETSALYELFVELAKTQPDSKAYMVHTALKLLIEHLQYVSKTQSIIDGNTGVLKTWYFETPGQFEKYPYFKIVDGAKWIAALKIAFAPLIADVDRMNANLSDLVAATFIISNGLDRQFSEFKYEAVSWMFEGIAERFRAMSFEEKSKEIERVIKIFNDHANYFVDFEVDMNPDFFVTGIEAAYAAVGADQVLRDKLTDGIVSAMVSNRPHSVIRRMIEDKNRQLEQLQFRPLDYLIEKKLLTGENALRTAEWLLAFDCAEVRKEWNKSKVLSHDHVFYPSNYRGIMMLYNELLKVWGCLRDSDRSLLQERAEDVWVKLTKDVRINRDSIDYNHESGKAILGNNGWTGGRAVGGFSVPYIFSKILDADNLARVLHEKLLGWKLPARVPTLFWTGLEGGAPYDKDLLDTVHSATKDTDWLRIVKTVLINIPFQDFPIYAGTISNISVFDRDPEFLRSLSIALKDRSFSQGFIKESTVLKDWVDAGMRAMDGDGDLSPLYHLLDEYNLKKDEYKFTGSNGLLESMTQEMAFSIGAGAYFTDPIRFRMLTDVLEHLSGEKHFEEFQSIRTILASNVVSNAYKEEVHGPLFVDAFPKILRLLKDDPSSADTIVTILKVFFQKISNEKKQHVLLTVISSMMDAKGDAAYALAITQVFSNILDLCDTPELLEMTKFLFPILKEKIATDDTGVFYSLAEILLSQWSSNVQKFQEETQFWFYEEALLNFAPIMLKMNENGNTLLKALTTGVLGRQAEADDFTLPEDGKKAYRIGGIFARSEYLAMIGHFLGGMFSPGDLSVCVKGLLDSIGAYELKPMERTFLQSASNIFFKKDKDLLLSIGDEVIVDILSANENISYEAAELILSSARSYYLADEVISKQVRWAIFQAAEKVFLRDSSLVIGPEAKRYLRDAVVEIARDMKLHNSEEFETSIAKQLLEKIIGQ